MIEVAVLLSLMIGSSAEDFQMYKIDWNRSEEIQLKSDVLLDNVRSVMKQIKVRAFFSVLSLCFRIMKSYFRPLLKYSYQHSLSHLCRVIKQK